MIEDKKDLLPGQTQGLPPAPQRTRAMLEGAMMAAIVVLMGWLISYIPFLVVLSPFLFPLPLAILVVRQGLRAGIFATVASTLLLMLIIGPFQAVLITLQFGALALFFGECLRKNLKPALNLAGCTVLTALGTVLALIFSEGIAGLPVGAVIDKVRTIFEQVFQFLEQHGFLKTLIPENIGMEAYKVNTYMVLPGTLLIVALILVIANYLISQQIFRRLGLKIPELPPFETWRLDWRLLWVFAGALSLNLLSGSLQISWLYTLGQNLFLICIPFLLAAGLSLILWFFRRWKVSYLIKIGAIVLAITLYSASVYLIGLIGIADSLVDARKLLGPRLGGQPQNKKK